MEKCYIFHPDLDWYLFPAFRINRRSPRKKWSRNPFDTIETWEMRKERKKDEIKESRELNDKWVSAKAGGISRREFLDSDLFSFLERFLINIFLFICKSIYSRNLQLYRDILSKRYLTFGKYSNPISKADDPRKRQIYEDKDTFHYQRLILLI